MIALSMLVMAAGGIAAAAAAETEKYRNEKVAVYDAALEPGATLILEGKLPSAMVYREGGAIEAAPPGAKPQLAAVKPGDVVFWPAGRQALKNGGSSKVRWVRVEFLGPGQPRAAPWEGTGLSSNYKVLIENQYARVYNIAIRAGTDEPLHTHHDRVVICFSGADIVHLMPDGRREPSTLKTGETVWRRGGTHIGQNLGKTDFWAIAVEPK